MFKIGATLLFVLLTAAAFASEHESVLDARRQGDIAPFGDILSAARFAAGGRTILLDAKFIELRGDVLMKVYLRRPRNGQVLVVTVDAVDLRVVKLIDRGMRAIGNAVDDEALANSRPIDPSKSASGSGPDSGTGAGTGGEGGKDPDSGGKDGGGGGKGGRDGGKDGGGRGDHSGGKGGDGGHDGGKGGSGK